MRLDVARLREGTFLGKLFKYLLTGGGSAAVDLTVFVLLHRVVTTIWIAALGSFAVAALCNYTATSSFVFREPLSFKKLALFYAYATLGMLVNVALTTAGTNIAHLQPVLAKIGGIGVAFIANFAFNYLWVFNQRPKGETRA